MVNQVWVCERLINGRWVIWFADPHQGFIWQRMRDAQDHYPKEEFRIVAYPTSDSPASGPVNDK